MNTQQLVLSLVLATMVFSVALELKVADFARIAQTPRSVVAGLVPQFLLLPVVTHHGRGNTALSVSVSVVAAVMALLAVPMALGLSVSHHLPELTARIRKPLGNFSLIALLAFIVRGLIKERQRWPLVWPSATAAPP